MYVLIYVLDGLPWLEGEYRLKREKKNGFHSGSTFSTFHRTKIADMEVFGVFFYNFLPSCMYLS